MVEKIFSELARDYRPGVVAAPLTVYFSIDEIKRTVVMEPAGCEVTTGRTVKDADCVCKMGSELFVRVWNEGYRPGLADFLRGAIKSNDPQLLKLFLRAFGRQD